MRAHRLTGPSKLAWTHEKNASGNAMKNKTQRGSAALEFAMVLPIFLLLVFAIFEFGLILYDKAVITNASREAARAGVVVRTTKLTATQIEKIATDYCSNYLISFKAVNPPTTVATGAGGSFGTPLDVTVTYTYYGLGLGALISPISGPITLTATTVMNNE
jgi:Flp pilus assembly protein TadG